MTGRTEYDAVIIGGGFYGCCLALFLRSVLDRVAVVEQHDELLTRASRVNQARVHFGFHYPRSFVTAIRSRALSARFSEDFDYAVKSDFRMLYAIARSHSKVSTGRFYSMFRDIGAPLAPARASDVALFDPALVAGVFDCTEYAFDWSLLRAGLEDRMAASGIAVLRGAAAERVTARGVTNVVELANGESLSAPLLINVTYAGLNRLLAASGQQSLPMKYELAEIALVTPPPELAGKAVTVMDGPFFSLMPYPAEGLYSLTHVRYTPQRSWVDGSEEHARSAPPRTRWRHMMADARRFLPCAADVSYRHSLFDTKSVLIRNERDDGRPILLQRHPGEAEFYSVMGGKIDNIYDLLEALVASNPRFAAANTDLLIGRHG